MVLIITNLGTGLKDAREGIDNKLSTLYNNKIS